MKSYAEINSSDFAVKKLRALSKGSGLDVDLVRALANFTWDYDRDVWPKESNGWVEADPTDRGRDEGAAVVAAGLGLDPTWSVAGADLVSLVLAAHSAVNETELWCEFCGAVSSKSYWGLSRFATYWWLHGATPELLAGLVASEAGYAIPDLARLLFLKLFRGGSLERSNLLYAWADLTGLGQPESGKAKASQVVHELAAAVGDEPRASLKDLLAACKGVIGGDKLFKQEVLQALSYSGILRVDGHPVSGTWLPDAQNTLSSHFYSNEWTYPLRFFGETGGGFNTDAIQQADPA